MNKYRWCVLNLFGNLKLHYAQYVYVPDFFLRTGFYIENLPLPPDTHTKNINKAEHKNLYIIECS